MTERRPLRVYWDDACLLHQPPDGLFEAGPEPLLDRPEAHPEGQQRIVNIRSVLRRGPLSRRVEFARPQPADPDDLCAFHEAAHVERLQRKTAGLTGLVQLDPQTWASPGTWSAAVAAAGGALAAARAVTGGEVDRAYALVRPPGHHAAPGRTDGFCVFNNTALAAAHCRLAGAKRVAVVDFDVHHGNGTQAGFYEDPNVLTLSIHKDHRSWGPSHPELGVPAELGAGAAVGANVNVALPFGCGDRAYASAFTRVVEPVISGSLPTSSCAQPALTRTSSNPPDGSACRWPAFTTSDAGFDAWPISRARAASCCVRKAGTPGPTQPSAPMRSSPG